ncbi:GNAT family N-acetyltransferase [Intrasporangium sp.]|uniref:GNAT family N-acetyltransferase n=1 Tax=Intrasporangium sp. TaxID=1925024 RepID=UPI003F8121C4
MSQGRRTGNEEWRADANEPGEHPDVDPDRRIREPEMSLQVLDVPERGRYEIVRDGQVLGFAAYQKANRLIVFTHTEVDPSLEGQGIGGRLIQGALDDVRTQGLPVLPICPFVHAWMGRHRDSADLDYRHPGSDVTD